jgi:hypothetical protein
MNILNAIKIGNIINLSVNGILEKKICASSEEAKSIFAMILKTKADPTDLNVKNLYLFLNNKVREVIVAGFECDLIDGNIYLEGFNTPVPNAILDVVKDYHENEFPYDVIVSFWKLLMINPDEKVRKSLFDFISKFNLVLTNHGYFLAYKAVKLYVDPKPVAEAKKIAAKAEADRLTTDQAQLDLSIAANQSNSLTELEKLVVSEFNKVKNVWKCAPKNYTVYTTDVDGKFHATETKTIDKWDLSAKKVTKVGCLKRLFEDIPVQINVPVAAPVVVEAIEAPVEVVEPTIIYTDKRTGTFQIILGQPVHMDRKKCDGDPNQDCSYGLHVGSTQYVEIFAGATDTVLLCLVNPAHVVAVPTSDSSKMRVSEYFPISVISRTGTKINAIEPSFFESDYIEYEKAELNDMVAKILKEQKPIEDSLKSKTDKRPLADMLKIIQTRIIDLK